MMKPVFRSRCSVRKFSALLFTAALALCPAATTAQHVPRSVPLDGLVGYWDFFNGTAADYSGAGNSGTLIADGSGAMGQKTPGVYWDALAFKTGQGVRVPSSASVNMGTGDFSIAAWFKLDRTDDYNTIIDKRTSYFTYTCGYHLIIQQNYMTLQIQNGWTIANFIDLNHVYTDRNWHHVVVSVDRDNPAGIRFYVDGVLTFTANPTSLQGNIDNSASLYIGRHNPFTTDFAHRDFNGSLDEVLLYRRVITDTEAKKIFTNTNVALHMACANNLLDSSGNSNNAARVGSTYASEFLASPRNQGYLFTGGNSLTIPSAPSMDLGTGDFTITTWVNALKNPVGNKIILDKRQVCGTVGIQLCLASGIVLLQIGDAQGYSNYYSNTTPMISDEKWHHIAVTVDRDAPNGMSLYIDDSLCARFDTRDRMGSVTVPDPLLLGKNNRNTRDNLQGFLDEVKLYPRCLSADEIKVGIKKSTFARGYTSVVNVANRLYMVGGFSNGENWNGPSRSIDVYDPVVNTWTISTSLIPTGRQGMGAVALNEQVYVIGGATFGTSAYPLSTVETFNPATGVWQTKRSLLAARSNFAVTVYNGKIYVFGGIGASGPLSSVEVYDPSMDTWTYTTPMPSAVVNAAAATLGGRIYVTGGFENSRFIASTRIFDPAAQGWSSGANLPEAVASHLMVVAGGSIYVIGGWDGTVKYTIAGGPQVHNVYNFVTRYNVSLNSWTRMNPMSTPRRDFGATILGDDVYCVDGVDSTGVFTRNVEKYTPASNFWLWLQKP